MNKKIFNKKLIKKLNKLKEENKKIYRGNNIWYRNEMNTRKCGIIYNYSKDEMIEYVRCSEDIIYFISKLQIALSDYQIDMIERFNENKFLIYHLSLEIGFTKIMSLIMLWKMLFNDDYNILFVNNKLATNSEYIEKIKSYYKQLPFYLQQGLKKSNRNSIYFENGSFIRTSISKSLAIGQNFKCIHLHEFDNHAENERFLQTIYPVVSAIKNSKLIISDVTVESDIFKKLCNTAQIRKDHPMSNSFVYKKYPWWNITGRYEDWCEEKKKIFTEKEFEKYYNCKY